MLKTFRTTHGFGIHSPFAFEMATSVLRGKTNYYDLEELNARSDVSGRTRSIGRLLFKLAVRFRPCEMLIFGDDNNYFEEVARLALLNLGEEKSRLKVFFFSGEAGGDASWRRFVENIGGTHEYIAVMLLSNKRKVRKYFIRHFTENLPVGMTFLARNRLMVVAALRHLPRQNYKMRF